jgi:DNA-binding FadR family transcriptional regulator
MAGARISDGRENRSRVRRSAKLAESVAHEIVRRISDQELAEGTQLPPEAEMLEEYGVGRASLREALRILEVQGLISIKAGPGGGPVVARVSTRDFGRMAALYFQFAGMTFRELMEARLIMEPVLARLAAERRAEHVGTVEELTAAAEQTDLGDDEHYLASSADFHMLVARASGNSIIFLLSHALEGILHDRVTGMLFPVDGRQEVVEAHKAVAAAIARGHAQRAETLMREHMQRYAKFVEERHPTLMDEVVSWR